MKWGKTNAQVSLGREPHLWFAWFPVHLEGGNWAWLEPVEREYAHTWGEGFGWIYRGL